MLVALNAAKHVIMTDVTARLNMEVPPCSSSYRSIFAGDTMLL